MRYTLIVHLREKDGKLHSKGELPCNSLQEARELATMLEHNSMRQAIPCVKAYGPTGALVIPVDMVASLYSDIREDERQGQ